MVKINDLLEISPVLTPEVIQAIAENSEALNALKSILSSGDEAIALSGCFNNNDDDCCCPKLVKFKIIAGTVIIINDNAECKKEKIINC